MAFTRYKLLFHLHEESYAQVRYNSPSIIHFI